MFNDLVDCLADGALALDLPVLFDAAANFSICYIVLSSLLAPNFALVMLGRNLSVLCLVILASPS